MRVTIQALAAVLGGAQSLHTNSMDEALALPSQEAVTLALRTQQIIAEESGVTNTVDPLGGSYFIETLTNQTEAAVYEYFRRIDDLGGVLPAIEAGFFQMEIADASYRTQKEIDIDDRYVVGVNKYANDEPFRIPILEMDPQGYERQVARLENLRLDRDNAQVETALNALRAACANDDNTMPCLIEAAKANATLSEITDVMREVFGVYREPALI
jgi:methylmalonyl-CoA mutase N-terminal domain/subunit